MVRGSQRVNKPSNVALGKRLLRLAYRHLLFWPLREFSASVTWAAVTNMLSFQRSSQVWDIQRMLHNCGLQSLIALPHVPLVGLLPSENQSPLTPLPVGVAFLSDRLKLRGCIMLCTLPVANCGGILASFIYPNRDGPEYRKGHTIVLGLLIAGWFW